MPPRIYSEDTLFDIKNGCDKQHCHNDIEPAIWNELTALGIARKTRRGCRGGMKQRKIDALITPRIVNESVDRRPQYSRDYLLSLGTTPPGTQSYDGCGISEQLCTRLALLNILNHSCPFHVPPSPQKLIQNK